MNPYRKNKDDIVRLYKKRGLEAVLSSCLIPVICVYIFLKEDFPNDMDYDSKINSLTKFYGYTEKEVKNYAN